MTVVRVGDDSKVKEAGAGFQTIWKYKNHREVTANDLNCLQHQSR